MIAKLTKVESGYTATFERQLHHPVEKVWSLLTENSQLKKWFSELQVDELREGGLIKFDMGDGNFEEMKILELKTNSVLEYTWGEDIVRFELFQKEAGCLLVLVEKINELTNHTPKDLAGWHVCLDVIEHLLNESEVGSREEAWKKLYEEYIKAVAQV
jgi:uncharacterized protein YndB with AHSA1/START domain